MKKKPFTHLLNIGFILACCLIVIFLLRAPEETTAKLPKDQNHERFYAMPGKKEAEKYCSDCHASDQVSPLPEGHPPKFRCLFCHKKQD